MANRYRQSGDIFGTKVGACILVCMAIGACSDPYQDPLPRRDRLHFPIGVEMHPDGRFLYAVNSNFDAKYRQNQGGTVSVIDVETRKIISETSPFIPSFGGSIELNEDASRAYITTRHENAVVALDVMTSDNRPGALDGQGLFCESASGEQNADTSDCVLTRVPDDESGEFIPSDPFGLEVMQLDDGNGGDRIDLINVSHLASTQLTTIAMPVGDSTGGSTLSSRSAAAAATMVTAPLLGGASDIANRPDTRQLYAAGRTSNDLVVYQPLLDDDGAVEALVEQDRVTLNSAVASIDARAATFHPSGKELYVVTRNPDALHIVSTLAAVESNDPEPQHKIVGTISLTNAPSDVVFHKGPDGVELLYVPSFDDEVIDIVNPEIRQIVGRIELGASPYSLVIDTAESRCQGEPSACHGYVSLFDDTSSFSNRCGEEMRTSCGSIGIIDLEPSSPRYRTLIDKIR